MSIFLLSLVAALLPLSRSAPLVDLLGSANSGFRPSESRSVGVAKRASSIAGPVIANDFPDPAMIPFSGRYYAFSTSSGGRNVPLGTTAGDLTWAIENVDALPAPGNWSTGINIWAPNVVQLENGKFVMYYSAPILSDSSIHCVGTATSETVEGPYVAANQPFACPAALGGAIDPSGYRDPTTGLRYVVYKVDGNHNGNGGNCLNTVEPIVPTPIQLQQVGPDGVSPVGEPVTILDRDDSDGPLVEAPSLYLSAEGIYFLFFSSGCYTGSDYDVKYATATNIAGPYTKAPTPLLKSGDGPNLNGPGGAEISANGEYLVFHANVNPSGGALKRAMFTAIPRFSGTTVAI